MEQSQAQSKKHFLQFKQNRREKKKTNKRSVTGEEVIFIFEKVLEGWKTIAIYNSLIQSDPNSGIDKKKTETIATGNCKVFENELPNERYKHYLKLRQLVYDYHANKTRASII